LTIVIALAVGGLGLFLSLRGLRWSAVVGALEEVQRGWLALAVLSSVGVAVLKATRWYRLFVPDQDRLAWCSVLATLVLAQTVNVIVPIRGLGEALRVGMVTRRFPVSALRVGGTIVLEKWLDLASLSLLALAVAPVSVEVVGEQILSTAVLLLIGGGLVGMALMVRFRERLRRWLGRWPRVARLLEQLSEGFNALRSGDVAWEPVAWTGGVRCLSLVSLLAALRSVGIPVPLLGIILLHVLLNFSYLLPTPPGMIGLVQYVTILVLGFFGVARAEALGAGVVSNLVILSPFLLFGLPAWLYVWGFSPHSVRSRRAADDWCS
jgi:hypothetical protein